MNTVIRTTIYSWLLRKTLLKGSLMACLGIGVLIYSGIFMTQTELASSGFFLFICGMALLIGGLLPYRRLNRLEAHPHTFVIHSQELEFYWQGNLALSIPIDAIQSIDYLEKGNIYGLAMRTSEKIVMHQLAILSRLKVPSGTNSDANLFFPYFSRYAAQELKEYI